MGRPGLTQHRKFKRLARALGSPIMARGALEILWDTCYENGNDYLGSSDDVELSAQWNGSDGVLTQALLTAGGEGESGFIEQDPERHGYRVHDLFENAPEYVQKRMLRELARNQRGETISSLRSAAGKKGRDAQLAGQALDKERANVGQTSDGCHVISANGGQAAASGDTPAPAPLHTNTTTVPNGTRRRRRSSVEIIQGFSLEAGRVVGTLKSLWHKEDPVDGRKIVVDLAAWGQRVDEILKAHLEITDELLIEAGKYYLELKRSRFQAPQFFFGLGKDGTEAAWVGCVKLVMTRKAQEVSLAL